MKISQFSNQFLRYLQGDNLLLSGAKATGKNVLCETLAWIFGRPEYDISFHVNTDSADLIGTDTFINNEVRLRKVTGYLPEEALLLTFPESFSHKIGYPVFLPVLLPDSLPHNACENLSVLQSVPALSSGR